MLKSWLNNPKKKMRTVEKNERTAITKSRREKSPIQDAENKDASSKKELKNNENVHDKIFN